MAEEKLGSLDDCYVTQANGKRAMAVTGGGQALDVLPQDTFSRSGDLYLLTELNSITLAQPPVVGEYTINLEAGHGVVAGNYITIAEGLLYYQARVTAVSTNQATMAIPNFYAFSVESPAFRKSARIETADGSVAPVQFCIGPPVGQRWHLYGFTLTLRDATDMDDAKFAGETVAATFKGLVIGKTVGGVFETRVNIASNSDMKSAAGGGGFEYSPKAPAGEYGLSWYKSLKDVNGVAMQLNGDLGETVCCLAQDAMTFLTYGRIMVHGHIVED